VKRLKTAAADEGSADVIATGVAEVGDEIATKADLNAGLTEMKTEMAELETRITHRFYVVAVLIVVADRVLDRFRP